MPLVPAVAVYVRQTLLKLTRVYFEGVHLAASLIAGLREYHQAMVGFIVDAVLEDLTLALDEPRPAHQQRHVAGVKLVRVTASTSSFVGDRVHFLLHCDHPRSCSSPCHVACKLSGCMSCCCFRVLLTRFRT